MHDYRERLQVPLAWWLLSVPTVLILGATLYAGLPWPWPVIIIGGLAVGCAAALIALGRGSVEVAGGALGAGGGAVALAAGLRVGGAAALIALGRGSVEVAGGALRAGGAELPLTAVGEIVILDEKQSTRLRGPRADPAAHLYLAPSLKESVYLALETAASTGPPAVPYWLGGAAR